MCGSWSGCSNDLSRGKKKLFLYYVMWRHVGNGGRAPLLLNLCTSLYPGHFTSGERALGGSPSLCGLSGEELKLLTFLGIKLWFLRLEACVVMILTELSNLSQMIPLILVCLLCGGGTWITSQSMCLLILYLCTCLYIWVWYWLLTPCAPILRLRKLSMLLTYDTLYAKYIKHWCSQLSEF